MLRRQHDGGVQVREGGGGRRVGQVVGGHVHGLDRRDRTGLGRGDALLQHAHFLGQRGLVTHGRRHAAQQRRHFGAGQRVAVDVVDEEQHVAAAAVRPASRRGRYSAMVRPVSATRRRLPGGSFIWPYTIATFEFSSFSSVDDARLDHLVIEVVAFAGTLADAGEHGKTACTAWRCC